jgi:protein TonB
MKARLHAFLGALFGLVLTVGLFSFVNSSFMMIKEPKSSKNITKFKVVKKQAKKITRIKPKKKPEKKQTLKPNMRNMIRGLSFGLPAFEMDLLAGGGLLGGDNYMNGKDVEIKPKVVYRPDLTFPQEALDKNINGYVVFGVFIDSQGTIEKVEIMESEPSGYFDDVAMENIKKWRFKPAKHKGVTVSTWQEQRITFDAKGEG